MFSEVQLSAARPGWRASSTLAKWGAISGSMVGGIFDFTLWYSASIICNEMEVKWSIKITLQISCFFIQKDGFYLGSSSSNSLAGKVGKTKQE